MTNDAVTPPSTNELEISIFGSGVGESLAIHIGGGYWILVDSCYFPRTVLPASLKYLYDLKVDVENSVLLVVASHWHRDHIRGMDVILEQCKHAQFAVTGAINGEFADLVKLYEKSSLPQSATSDISKVFAVLEKHKQDRVKPKYAISDRPLLRKTINRQIDPTEIIVHSLSPSDDAIGKAFAKLHKKLSSGNPAHELRPDNHVSVALWLEVANNYILLGGDLECTNDPGTGWSAILERSLVASSKAQVFKVPHHGSKNAHHPDVWEFLLENHPIALLTPYISGSSPIPTSADCKRVIGYTPHAYATAPTSQPSIKLRDKTVARTFREATRSSNDLYRRWGQVQIRKFIDEESYDWRVNLFGTAYMLT